MNVRNIVFKSLSLGIGLAAGIVLISKVCYEMSFDRFYKDADRIYHIRTLYSANGKNHDYYNISGAIAPAIRQYVPGVESATRTTFIWNSDKFIDEDKRGITGSVIVADSCFFDIFSTEILAGNPKEVLSQAASAMVSESFAGKMGGTSEVIGKTIENEEYPGFKITIGGVFKDYPYHSTVKKDVLLSMESLHKASTENWLGNDRYRGYVKLAEGTDPDLLAPAIREMQMKNQPLEEMQKNGADIRYYLTSMIREHISDTNVKNVMIVLSIVAVLLILISLLNYILISVSAMVVRSKEMGVRKCYGAGRSVIFGIMAKEAATDIAAALFVAAILLVSFKPILEDLVGVPAEALLVVPTYIAAGVMFISVFIAAAIVPGYLYSKIPVSSAFRNYSENKRFWKLGLLFFQTGICAFLLSLMLVIGAQYRKAVNDKPGYEYGNLLWTVLTGTDYSLHQGIIDELMQLPEVSDVQMSYSLPLDYSSGNNIYMPEGPNKDKELFNIADQYEGSAGLFDMLEIPFIEGRYPQTESEVAVSESFLKEMAKFEDWSNGAVGKSICITEHSQTAEQSFTISGVYKDYRINTLTNQDTRASIKFFAKTGEGNMPFMAIKVSEISHETMEKVRNVIQSRLPSKEIEVKAYKDSMREAYSDERRMKNTLLAGCLISIIIALFGLTGYIRDESQRRSKEMAIRKINGATNKEILSVYIVEILKISVIAIILGNIGAWSAASVWLENFSEKVALSPLFFISADAIILTLIISGIVTGTFRIVRSNPVDSLKNE